MLPRSLVLATVSCLVACTGPEPKPAPSDPQPPAELSAVAVERAPVLPPSPAGASPAVSSVVPDETDLREHLFVAAPSSGPRPMVVVLHGYGTSASVVAKILAAEAVAEEQDVHLLLPNGTEDAQGLRAWNATDACCDFDGREVDDVAAIDALIADKLSRHDVDPDRIYVAGFSNGAFMAHRLACDLSERLAGVVAMSGVGFRAASRCRPEAPVSLLQIHGDADPIVAYGGGHVLGRTHLPAHPSSDVTAARWAEHNGCSGHREEPMAFSGRPTSRRVYLGCQAAVERWRVEGGGHVLGTDRGSVRRALSFLLSQRRVSAPPAPGPVEAP